MHMETASKSKAVSATIAGVAMALLLLYLADDAVANSHGRGTGFLPIDAVQRGIVLGTASLVLFFVAFAINWKAKSMMTAVLLIAGGALRGTAMLGIILMLGGFAAFSPTFHAGMLLGYVIMGLGIWQAVRIRKRAHAVAAKR